MTPHQLVKQRSGDRCEAMIMMALHDAKPGEIIHVVPTRCFRWGTEVHHMITRSRGGLILDDAGETMHLLALCPAHHREAHAPGGYDKGLMIDGYIHTENGRVVYQGSHHRLRELYGSMDLPALREEVPSDLTSEGL